MVKWLRQQVCAVFCLSCLPVRCLALAGKAGVLPLLFFAAGDSGTAGLQQQLKCCVRSCLFVYVTGQGMLDIVVSCAPLSIPEMACDAE
jgi:hypothetical protein